MRLSGVGGGQVPATEIGSSELPCTNVRKMPVSPTSSIRADGFSGTRGLVALVASSDTKTCETRIVYKGFKTRCRNCFTRADEEMKEYIESVRRRIHPRVVPVPVG